MIKNTLKRTKFEDKTVKSTQLSLVLVGLHDFQIFPDRTAHARSVEVGNICSVSVFFVRVGSQISPCRAKKDSNPPLGEEDQSNALPQGQQRQSNPHPMPCLPHAGMTLIGALEDTNERIKNIDISLLNVVIFLDLRKPLTPWTMLFSYRNSSFMELDPKHWHGLNHYWAKKEKLTVKFLISVC